MDYPAGVLGTYMELYQAEVGRFVSYLRGLSSEELKAQGEFAGAAVTMQGILEHVVYAGLAYAEDARGAIQGEAAKKKIELPRDLIAGVQAMVPRMAEALAGEWQLSEAECAGVMIDTPWGQRFSLDQMMEHAIVHVLWHRRQCGRVVAKAKGESA